MKLWQKIALICSAVLVCTVAIMSTLLIIGSKNNILELTYEQARNKQRNIASSFSEMTNYYIDKDNSHSVKNSVIQYCFTRFADMYSVLVKNDKTLYSKISIAPEEYLDLEKNNSESGYPDKQRQYVGEIDGKTILIIGSQVVVQGDVYSVYVVNDISPVYESITGMIWRFVLIGGSVVVVGLVFIILLIRRSMRPLADLKQTAGRIAAGGYDERVLVTSNDEVGALAIDFNNMADAVECRINELTETAQRQRLFISGVTHEYKTPLTTLILNSDTLQNAYLSDEERDTALSHIASQCRWLEHMTQKLLKLITLKQDIELHPCSVQELFKRVEESVAQTFEERGTKLVTDCKTTEINMDMDLMQSVLVNLAENASKASKPGQTVYMKAYDNVIEVKDEGIGIPEADISRITEPFYMVDKSRSKKQGGSGLGLALVSEIAAAHGAELEIESELQKGTTVRVRFAQ